MAGNSGVGTVPSADIPKRLRASVKFDAINGTVHERAPGLGTWCRNCYMTRPESAEPLVPQQNTGANP